MINYSDKIRQENKYGNDKSMTVLVEQFCSRKIAQLLNVLVEQFFRGMF